MTPRTVRRDIELLRRLGYAIEARPGPGSSYRLVPGLVVPPLLFDEAEISAIVTGLRFVRGQLRGDDAAARALVKLEQVLSSRLRLHAVATDVPGTYTRRPPPAESLEKWFRTDFGRGSEGSAGADRRSGR